jgi:hypothetical protein
MLRSVSREAQRDGLRRARAQRLDWDSVRMTVGLETVHAARSWD